MRRFALVLLTLATTGLTTVGCAAAAPAGDVAFEEEPESGRLAALYAQGDRHVARARPGDSLVPAIRTYQAILKDHPFQFRAHLRLARCYYLMGQSDLEQAEYLKALAVNPRSVEAWERLGHARLSLDALEGARAAYEEVLRLEPMHAVVLYNLGLVEQDLGHPERARELHERWRAAAPKRPSTAVVD